jgi:hypothetical protein
MESACILACSVHQEEYPSPQRGSGFNWIKKKALNGGEIRRRPAEIVREIRPASKVLIQVEYKERRMKRRRIFWDKFVPKRFNELRKLSAYGFRGLIKYVAGLRLYLY